jgi:cytidylate kinase
VSVGAPVFTLDGPSGAGKGTVASLVAQAMGWHLLDSGAIYRLVGLAAQRSGVRLDDLRRLSELAGSLEARFVPGSQSEPARVVWGAEDVTEALRSEGCGQAASRIAAIPEVREALLTWQRSFRRAPGLVADGRDMGTVVFPDALVKVFLTASAEERARRRHKQLKELGMDANLDAVLQDMVRRDARDVERSVSPLRPASDAWVLDTTGLAVAEVFTQVTTRLRRALDQTG